MRLQRVQVPEFRVLKDVDITFEKEFVPNIFPLGSQNGGGKSTLLQLIFVLLHCSANPERHVFLQNMLYGFTIDKDSVSRTVATVEIWTGVKVVKLEFRSYQDSAIPEIINNSVYICNYSTNLNSKNDKALLCHIKNLDMSEADSFFNQLSQKVFLAASTTQSFLFFYQGNKKLLFKESNKISYFSDYYSLIKFAKSRLKGLFTYDFIAVELLIEAFKASRDKDFREAIEKGDYGNSYKTLINDVDAILVNKKIKLDADLSGVTFQFDRNGEKIELYPEDLSHGELKRLSIYMWIKYHNIEDAIVLMDELETAFHPDWQYQIISDLFQWSPSNQYIIATHSYELCQALIPGHVKEIKPKVLKQVFC